VLKHEIGGKKWKNVNPIKGAKGVTNDAYFIAFLSSNTYIDISVYKLLCFLVKVQHLKIPSLVLAIIFPSH
jgi:hypothetical protein